MTDQPTPAPSTLPVASGGFGDKPTLTFPGASAPAGLQVHVLAEGDGPVVTSGRTIVVHYLGQVWDGAIFDTSYDRGETISFPIGVGAVIGGWDKGLVGQSVGSRVLLSIPPEHGYGMRGVPQAGIGGGDTLVFVVDVVGVE
ncbi:FKBP-type peptidyl-prolyl cis-trans isomerase [Oerskovia flava]|uniref:FKBP-type peptidyl-prolyl cis-trans isomerase n=1 Tax=Oerskovia flava TaxID=2986422 RepID=UPI00223F8C46|nr:FKBP-type peptidyl-prolyl cis-trans isomerase [Oerskovia sp. JB1-3-2]